MSWAEVAASALGGGVAGGGIALLLARQAGSRAEEGRVAEETRRAIDDQVLQVRLQFHRMRAQPEAYRQTTSPGDMGELAMPLAKILQLSGHLPSWERRRVQQAIDAFAGAEFVERNTNMDLVLEAIRWQDQSLNTYTGPLTGINSWPADDARWQAAEAGLVAMVKRIRTLPTHRRWRLYGG